MNHQEFLGEVQRLGRFASDEETRAVVANVLMAMAEVLPREQLDGLAAALPPELLVYLARAPLEPDPYFDSHLFLGWVVSTADVTGSRDRSAEGLDSAYSADEAIRRCQVVFSVLKRLMEPVQHQRLAGFLPDLVESWFLEA